MNFEQSLPMTTFQFEIPKIDGSYGFPSQTAMNVGLEAEESNDHSFLDRLSIAMQKRKKAKTTNQIVDLAPIEPQDMPDMLKVWGKPTEKRKELWASAEETKAPELSAFKSNVSVSNDLKVLGDGSPQTKDGADISKRRETSTATSVSNSTETNQKMTSQLSLNPPSNC